MMMPSAAMAHLFEESRESHSRHPRATRTTSLSSFCERHCNNATGAGQDR